jgi:hypothetical protein
MIIGVLDYVVQAHCDHEADTSIDEGFKMGIVVTESRYNRFSRNEYTNMIPISPVLFLTVHFFYQARTTAVSFDGRVVTVLVLSIPVVFEGGSLTMSFVQASSFLCHREL